MKILFRWTVPSLSIILLSGLLLYFSGCGKQTPISPTFEASGVSSSATHLTFLKHSGPSTAMLKTVTVSQLITVQDGGELLLQPNTRQEVLDLIKQEPPLGSFDLKNQLVVLSPLTPTELLAVIHRAEPMGSYYLKKVLKENSPLSPTVLLAAIDRPEPMKPVYLKDVLVYNAPLRTCVLQRAIDSGRLTPLYLKRTLIDSSPLPPEIVDQVEAGTTGLTDLYRDAVLSAQEGIRGSEWDMNNGVGEVVVSLQLLPGAVNEDTELSISLDDEDLVGDFYVTFGPHGVNFNQSVILNIEACGLDLFGGDPDAIDIFYDNTDTGQWELMPRENVIVNQNEGYVKVINAQLPHFSRYAVAFAN